MRAAPSKRKIIKETELKRTKTMNLCNQSGDGGWGKQSMVRVLVCISTTVCSLLA